MDATTANKTTATKTEYKGILLLLDDTVRFMDIPLCTEFYLPESDVEFRLN